MYQGMVLAVHPNRDQLCMVSIITYLISYIILSYNLYMFMLLHKLKIVVINHDYLLYLSN